MIITLLRLLPVLLLAGWQVSWAESAPDTPQQAVSPAAPADTSSEAMLKKMQAAPARGLFYKISNKGKQAYLFGTLHVGKHDFFPLDMATTQALAESSVLAVELDATQTDKLMAATQRYAMLPSGFAPTQTLTLILRGAQSPTRLPGSVAQHFQLTPAEFKLCEALVGGASLKRCAQNWGRSYDTLRSQLKSILAKTETHRQAELITLISIFKTR